ncbi:phosphatase PAP2 family protein [Shewanella sp. JM162201]|uniref:undecaprenyl-diphosphate phosphatase n=1 Tax=Shewanella jiangmenensis TaxID=2837387 RepID=A0ABS5V6Z6_9GAMM|nr:phosphatase PAP2 family protein [Shewanella jiangmenensis]MBT1445426.1 phosphatase PAP2 family protein [Shewanella jiangmenensis]
MHRQGVTLTKPGRFLSLAALWLTMLLPPALLQFTDINLFPLIALDGTAASFFYGITFSGTAPWGAITAAAVVAYGFVSLSRIQATRLLLAAALALGAGLLLNETLKSRFDAPRPNAEYLAKAGLLDLEQFYRQAKAGRQAMMSGLMQAPPPVIPKMSAAINGHWQQEVGYSFPSGHTLFAVVLSLTACWYFLASGHWLLVFMLTVWALAMGFSRMLLGMHYSEDVLVATLIALPLSLAGIGTASLLKAANK